MARITVRDQVLNILSARRGRAYSGQQLAEEIGVSRAAVWKAVESLRASGYGIEGATRTGYVMASDTDVLSSAEIADLLTTAAKKFYRIETVDLTGSTNDDLKQRAAAGEDEGLFLAACRQTAGKGRRGRNFYSPESTGLYMSILLRPQMAIEDCVLITTAAAVAGALACDSILAEQAGRQTTGQQTTGQQKDLCPPGKDAVSPADRVMIKWVNDLFIRGRKFSGILTEAAFSMETKGLDYAVMGIGFNLNPPEGGWPENIASVAGSLFEEHAEGNGGQAGVRNRLAAAFLNEFYEIYQKLPDVTYLKEYRARSLAVGKTVEVLEADGSRRKATVLDVDDRCELIVRYEGEEKETVLNSGEISIRL